MRRSSGPDGLPDEVAAQHPRSTFWHPQAFPVPWALRRPRNIMRPGIMGRGSRSRRNRTNAAPPPAPARPGAAPCGPPVPGPRRPRRRVPLGDLDPGGAAVAFAACSTTPARSETPLPHLPPRAEAGTVPESGGTHPRKPDTCRRRSPAPVRTPAPHPHAWASLISGSGSGGRSPGSGARRSPTAACWRASRRRSAPGRPPRCSRQPGGDPAAPHPLDGRGSGGRRWW
jgi:hypothetical protein